MNPAETYILEAKEPFRSIMLHLQLVIETAIPEVELKYKWHLPFYYFKNNQGFCYLNNSKHYVDLGFTRGTHLTLHTDKLVSEGRKHMKSLRYYTLEDVNEEVLIEVLQEAYAVRHLKYYK